MDASQRPYPARRTAGTPLARSRYRVMRATLLALILALCGPPLASAAGAAMTLKSPAFAPGGAIPSQYSAYGENRSPPLTWTAAPGARAYALTLRDPDARPGPFTHWLVWNIPGAATRLPAGGLPGAVQGRNDTGGVGYFGPRPPAGVHHYHFRIMALDAPLALPAGADLAALTKALQGHVTAEAELVGTFAR
jgi:Raf kinase inhibitor-like YbhB/YbcL family protein